MRNQTLPDGGANQLLELIRRERRCGNVTLAVIPVTTDVSVLEACKLVVQHVGFMPPRSWVGLPLSAARLHLVRCLHRDLAYSQECMAKPTAEMLAKSFFSLFGEQRLEYFTNILPWHPAVYEREKVASRTGLLVITEDEVEQLGWGKSGGAWASTGLTNSTFDSGLVVVSPYQVGILWFQDED